MRLGVRVAIHVDPDVLLIDEVLAVGDESFTHKCLGQVRRVPPAQQDRAARHARAEPGGAILTIALWLNEAAREPWATAARSCRPTSPTSRSRKNATWPTPTRKRARPSTSGQRTDESRAPDPNPVSAEPPGVAATDPPRNVSSNRGPLGLPRGRDLRRRSRRRGWQRALRVLFGERVEIPAHAQGRQPPHRLRRRHRHLQRRRACARSARTPTSKNSRATASRARGTSPSPWTGSISWPAPTNSTWRCTNSTGSRTTTPPALQLPREIAHAGRRHLPPAPRVELRRRRLVQGAGCRREPG